MLLCFALALVCCITALPAFATEGPQVTFQIQDEVVTTKTAVDGKVTLPSAPTTVTGFIGWGAEINGQRVFLPENAVYEGVNGPMTFTAVIADFSTNKGSSVRFEEDSIGIRFTSNIARKDYENLILWAGGKDKVVFGTYIAPTKYLADTKYVFTVEALTAKGHTYLDVVANDFYTTDEDSLTVAGSISKMRNEHATLEFTGIGYMKVTYTSGEIRTVYALYNRTNNSANVLQTVLAAYNDRNEDYSNLVMEGDDATHSPYTLHELTLCREYLDKIVMVGHDAKYNYFALPTNYYKTPWIITFQQDSFLDSTIFVKAPEGRAITDVKGVYLDGLHISMAKTQLINGILRFHHSAFSGSY